MFLASLHRDVEIVQRGACFPGLWISTGRNVQDHIVTRVDDRRSTGMRPLSLKMTVSLVHMSVDHVLRLPLLKEWVETVKSAVRVVIEVAPALCGGMGEQNVEAVSESGLKVRADAAHLHFHLRVHVRTLPIPD